MKIMKNFLSVLVLVTLVNLIFSSCKKDTPITLFGKWNIVSMITKQDGVITDNYAGLPADYIDFKSSGIVEFFSDGDLDKYHYVISGTTVKIDVIVFDFSFSGSNCTLSAKNLEFKEIYIVLKK